jgi:hypothetical protein
MAVESALSPVILDWLKTYGPHKEYTPSYAYQVNVLTRVASRSLGVKDLPDCIRQLLDKMSPPYSRPI